jgi:hypothetical protein
MHTSARQPVSFSRGQGATVLLHTTNLFRIPWQEQVTQPQVLVMDNSFHGRR